MDLQEKYKKHTMTEIAKLAKVSQKTVSRVVNGEKYVKKETAEKIKKIIEIYKFKPNFFASGLRTGKSNTIGLIIGNIENPYFAYLSNEIISYSETQGYNVIMACDSNYDDKHCNDLVDMLISRNIDGLIVCSMVLDKETINRLKEYNKPFIQISCPMDLPYADFVTADDYFGGMVAAEYIMSLGHKKIFFLRIANIYSANERVRAFKNAAKKHNIIIEKSDISNPLIELQDAYDEVIKIIESGENYSAIIAGNDMFAIEAMRAILDKGLKIPDDISLIGYDNLNITKALSIPLTTVNQPPKLFASIAIKRLIEILENPNSNILPMKTIFKPELVIRNSCSNKI